MNSSDKTIEEYSKQAELATERRRKSKDIARKLWQGLVVNVGKTQAKEIMREVMDDKKPGPRSTDTTGKIAQVSSEKPLRDQAQ